MKKKLKNCTLSDLLRTCNSHYKGKDGCKGCPFNRGSVCITAMILSPVPMKDWEREFNITEEA